MEGVGNRAVRWLLAALRGVVETGQGAPMEYDCFQIAVWINLNTNIKDNRYQNAV
jgi:hypothetical protein